VDLMAGRTLDALPALAAGPAVLAAGDRFPGLWLVGGAVRDLVLGEDVRDLDVAVEGEIDDVAAALGTVLSEHGRFGTAEIAAPDGGRVNLVRTRAEAYARPGALPEVRPAGIDEDLARRDFTLNAIAVGLSASNRGELRAVEHARDDLESRRARVLHAGSFLDDPTRLLRLARYATRLGLAIEGRTAALANKATLRTISGDRVGNEVRLALAEPAPVDALVAAWELGGPPVPEIDPALARAGLALLPPDGRPDLLVLATARLRAGDLLELGFTGPDARRAARAGQAASLAEQLMRARRPSEIAATARDWPPEAVALAGALGVEEPARAWLDRLRGVQLAITGHDLLAAGVPEGPEVGRRLAATLDRRLDGELEPGREAELAAALASSA
jgi:tRNA nucleotidyltransferase (CCA-adding enzyme)